MNRFDAIVVLGAAVWENETPSPTLVRRTKHACGLYAAGVAPLLIGSGGLGKFPPTEAEMIRRIAIANGVPEHAVLTEDQSHTTLQNVLYSARVFRKRGLKSVMVVSDKYHLPRAVLCFRTLGFTTAGSGPDRGISGTPTVKWIYYHIRELAALPFYILKLPKLREMFQSTGE